VTTTKPRKDDVLLPSKKRANKQAARLLDRVREIENL
jgi:hypothetical protein